MSEEINEVLNWSALRINRRKLLKRASVAAFGAFAGLAVGVPTASALCCPCCAPFSGGPCGSCLCNGCQCKSGCGAVCQYTQCCCIPGQAACWGCGNAVCCDCQCRSGSFGWYCYCYGC
jgi:hypothetical protein